MILKLIILLCIALITGGLAKRNRLLSGRIVDITEYPYQVALKIITDNSFVCAGAIISNHHVLTAAHCVADRYNYYDVMRVQMSSSSVNSASAILYEILNVDIHPAYAHLPPDIESWIHDIAVITLLNTIVYDDYQRNVPLPTEAITYNGVATFIGWGKVHPRLLEISNQLRQISTEVISSEECQTFFVRTVHPTNICTKNPLGRGACIGDSGGPLIKNGKLVGILSSIVPCGIGFPDIYVDVFDHIGYINYIVNRQINPSPINYYT